MIDFNIENLTPIYAEVRNIDSAASLSRITEKQMQGRKDMRTSLLAEDAESSSTSPADPIRECGSDKIATSGTTVESTASTGSKDLGRHSAAFAEFILKENIEVMGPLLNGLKNALDQPDGARYMVGFREAVGKIWDVREALPKETILALSAIEESIRGTKWRELLPSQVDVLSSTVAKLRGRGFPEKDLIDSMTSLQRNWLDIFPSAEDDYERLEDGKEEA